MRKKKKILFEIYDENRLTEEQGLDVFEREFQPHNTASVALIASIMKHPLTAIIILGCGFWIIHALLGAISLIEMNEDIAEGPWGTWGSILGLVVLGGFFFLGGPYPTYKAVRVSAVDKFTVFSGKLGFYNGYSNTWRVCNIDDCIGMKSNTEFKSLDMHFKAPKEEEPHIEQLASGEATNDLLQLLSTRFGLPSKLPGNEQSE